MEWTVLCVSKISPAQITRNMILERAGYQVVAIDDPDKAIQIFKTSDVSAVVFGDSINGELRFQLARTFKTLNHAVPIVALSKTTGAQVPTGLVDQQLESLGDPHLLLEALRRVLSRDDDSSAQKAPVHDHNQNQTSPGGRSSAKAASSPDGDGSSVEIPGPKTQKKSGI